MSKAFTKETDADADDGEADQADALPANTKNYVTPSGHAALQAELRQLRQDERPKLVEIVSWAASNGDRSENGDYIYGKKRLREIDRRLRFLTKRLEAAEVVDPAAREPTDQIFFGASVRYATEAGDEREIMIVGVDEVDLARGHVSWISPIARALVKAREGDSVTVKTPAGEETVDVLEVRYK